MIKHLFFTVLLILPTYLFSQRSADVGIFLGASTYQGDMSPDPFYAGDVNLAIGGVYRYFFTPKVALKAIGVVSKLEAADINVPRQGYLRLWEMDAPMAEVSLNLEWHPFARARFSEVGLFRMQYSPFVSLGVGGTFANSKLTVPEIDRFKVPEKGDKSFFLAVPISAGIRFDISESFNMTMDVGSRYVFSDYLDGVSENGNPDAKDWYIIGGIGVVYHIDSEREVK